MPLTHLEQHEIEEIETAHPHAAAILPVTPLQREQLRHTLRTRHGADVCTLQMAYDLEGALDADALRTACRSLLERHPALRASFLLDHRAGPLQTIAREADLPWRFNDLSGMLGEDQQVWCTQLLEADRARRFDVTRPPLMRFTLVRLAPDHHVLLVSAHQALLDERSLTLLRAELFRLYEAGPEQSPSVPGAAFPEQLTHLARLHRQEHGVVGEVSRDKWTRGPEGFGPASSALVADVGGRLLPESHTTELGEERTDALRKTARHHGLTLGIVVRTAWGLVLRAHTGRDEFVFGATVPGRASDAPGAASLIGPFAHLVPVRFRAAAEDTLVDLAARLRDEDAVVRSLRRPDRENRENSDPAAGGGDLSDAHMAFHDAPFDPTALRRMGGVDVRGVDVRGGTHYPLSLDARASGAGLTLRLDHRTDRYDSIQARALAGRLVRELERLAATPDAAVGPVPHDGARVRPVPGPNAAR
ncbi:condensation domain-containing protein [Streptomyces sp. NPDC090442]|uniref:condensation domain-containing protein n=1 Tax=Streptomyces sp. NPDC090442 TaxID=3365962 RepID=UPI00382167CB